MKKIIFAISTVMFLTSCVGEISQKIKTLLGKESADSTTAVVATTSEEGDVAEAADATEDIKDLPLMVAPAQAEPYWYAPVGFTPSNQLSGDEYAALSEEQQEAEDERGQKEKEAFISMLKQNKERYTKLLMDGTWSDVEYVDANFDRGEEATFALSWEGDELKDHMKYVRYRNKDGRQNRNYGYGMLFTKDYVDGRKFIKVTTSDLSMPNDVFLKVEQLTGKKIAKVPYGYALGNDYSYFVVQFVGTSDTAFAAHAVVTPDGLALSEIETADVDEDGNAMWAVDMEGEYPMIDICIGETKDGVLKIWYNDLAPEHACLGAFIVKGNRVVRREYSQNYVWVR